MGYITQTKDYWIAPNAVNITLNALGEANRIQGSVASGAVIMCYLADIKPARMGEEYAKNGDGLLYTNGHEYKTWPLSLSPTYFNSFTHKYVYCAIPRSVSVGSQAVIVFPSEQIDIYGCAERVTVDPETGETVTDEEGNPVMHDEQIGSEDYFYVYLQGIIGCSGQNGTTLREWEDPIGLDEWGTLDTAGGRDSRVNDSEWYKYDLTTQLVTFMKNITMKDGTSFLKLFAEDTQIKIIKGIQQLVFSSNSDTPITGVATKANADNIPDNSTQHIVTPSYLDEFGNTRYLSKIHDDTAAGLITFQQGLKIGSPDGRYGIDGNGAATFLDIIFDRILKSKDARPGFSDGHGIWMDALQGLIETDGMNVRGFMRVMELIINRLQLMESDYSFTEGDTVERVDYYVNPDTGGFDGTLLLTMHKDHDNDFTPFYPGDIIYGIKNDLLPKDGTVPDGHSVTRSGASYFRTWMRVISVDLSKNQLRVQLYQGRRYIGTDEEGLPMYEAIVPGGTNFSLEGLHPIGTDVTAPLMDEYDEHDGEGWETMLTVTRHGNVADGIDPETGERDEHIYQSQLGRQQAWVLSTTDKRLSFFWNVDAPIIRDENYALCLGILPDLVNLPTNRNKAMPSLYVNTLFADHTLRANWPAKIVKVDRGQWTSFPMATYTGETGTYTPDGTLPEDSYYGDPTLEIGYGDQVYDPYHFRAIPVTTYLRFRISDLHYGMSDAELLAAMRDEWHEEVDIEVSRVWNHGALWECLVDGTTQEPWFGCTDWMFISGGTFSLGFFDSLTDPVPIMGIAVRPAHIDETIVPFLLFSQEDATGMVTQWRWERESNKPALDEAWANSMRTDPDDPTSPLKSESRVLHLTIDDLPVGWDVDGGRVGFKCTATFLMDGEETEIINSVTII